MYEDRYSSKSDNPPDLPIGEGNLYLQMYMCTFHVYYTLLSIELDNEGKQLIHL